LQRQRQLASSSRSTTLYRLPAIVCTPFGFSCDESCWLQGPKRRWNAMFQGAHEWGDPACSCWEAGHSGVCSIHCFQSCSAQEGFRCNYCWCSSRPALCLWSPSWCTGMGKKTIQWAACLTVSWGRRNTGFQAGNQWDQGLGTTTLQEALW